MQEEGLPTFPPLGPRIPSGCKVGRDSRSGCSPSCQLEDAHSRIEAFAKPFHHCCKEPPQVFLPLSPPQVYLLAGQLCGTSTRLQPGLATWLLSKSKYSSPRSTWGLYFCSEEVQ